MQPQESTYSTALPRLLAVSVALIALAGCATPYMRHGFFGGYSEKKIGEASYLVKFDGNGYSSKERVWYFWIYRCAELTRQHGYEMFALPGPEAAGAEPTAVRKRWEASSPALVEPAQSAGAAGYPYYEPPRGLVTTYHASGTIHMLRVPSAGEQALVLRAGAIIEALKPYVDSGGKATPPTRAQVLERAAVEPGGES
ncbi:MAG TPA: hypothetical protein VMH32_12985 [Burkholderiales bacterium]|nr:hypothetical protein [Burkholderiales bacterium]